MLKSHLWGDLLKDFLTHRCHVAYFKVYHQNLLAPGERL